MIDHCLWSSRVNEQLPIESQLAKKLADNMNAEVVLGTIRSRDEAVEWLTYTYLLAIFFELSEGFD